MHKGLARTYLRRQLADKWSFSGGILRDNSVSPVANYRKDTWTMRVHLDTDFAGDTDDAAALVMLLGCPEAEIVGITTIADPDGRRAGYVEHVLQLAGRPDITVAAGASRSLTTGLEMGAVPDHERYWGSAVVTPRPAPDGAATDLLDQSVQAGAVLIGIGPWTNLALLEQRTPGALSRVPVVLMGGWARPPADGLPQWGPDLDWNVQCDTSAALSVFTSSGRLSLVTVPETLAAQLRGVHLSRLEGSGPLGQLLARQALSHRDEYGVTELAKQYPSLPDDLLNFQYDPAACAVALGWESVKSRTVQVLPVLEGGILRFEESAMGKLVDALCAVSPDDFGEQWLASVVNADRKAAADRVSRPAEG
jgi:purine nucleosidase